MFLCQQGWLRRCVAERVAAELDLESASNENRDFIVSVTHFFQAMCLAFLTSYVESVIWLKTGLQA